MERGGLTPPGVDRILDKVRVGASDRVVPADLLWVTHINEPAVSLDPNSPKPVHRSVLLNEVLSWFPPREGAVLVDGTVGAGGHAAALATRVGSTGRVIGLDRDPEMLALAGQATSGLPVSLVQAPYSDLADILYKLELDAVDGILLDLGLSSDQLAWAERGFSFAADGPLDMRFDPNASLTAAEVVNTWKEEELANLFFEYGEERYSRRVAKRIVEGRRIVPITTTGRLAEIVRKSIPGKWGPIDPATRVFQALRIRVNDELDHLESILEQLPELLHPGGRAVIISFHSLEDRRVKVAFRDDPNLKALTRKPVMASAEEMAVNPRARSAKLRVAERCPIQEVPPLPSSKRSKERGGDR